MIRAPWDEPEGECISGHIRSCIEPPRFDEHFRKDLKGSLVINESLLKSLNFKGNLIAVFRHELPHTMLHKVGFDPLAGIPTAHPDLLGDADVFDTGCAVAAIVVVVSIFLAQENPD